jgi:hypothetical protein
MRQFTMVAATVAIAALISAAPASAENIGGGPLQQKGMCWQSEKHSAPSEASWGYWMSCAEKASRPGRRGGGAASAQATPRRRS